MISPCSLSPKSLKSNASFNNSKKKHEYWDCTICLSSIRGKKTEFVFGGMKGGVCLLVYFLYLTSLNIFSFIFIGDFSFPP